jgi:hypothetical protein
MMMSVATVYPSTAGEFSDKRLAKFGTALAAVLCQKEHEAFQRVYICSLDLLAAPLLRENEARLHKNSQVR